MKHSQRLILFWLHELMPLTGQMKTTRPVGTVPQEMNQTYVQPHLGYGTHTLHAETYDVTAPVRISDALTRGKPKTEVLLKDQEQISERKAIAPGQKSRGINARGTTNDSNGCAVCKMKCCDTLFPSGPD